MVRSLLPKVAALFCALAFFGCDNKEKILDVDTPDGGVEVEVDRDTGALDVDAD